MKNTPTINIPTEVKNLPILAQMAWINAFNSSIDSGNTEETSFRVAWATVRSGFKQDKTGSWIQKDETENLLAGINSAVDYSGINIDSEGCIEVHLASVGADPDITEDAVNNWIENFESNARGQYIPLVVDHPFFKEYPTDTKARGWVKSIYRKGDADIIAKVKLTPLGVKTITDQEYLYISPGWFPKYQHVLFGNDVKDVLFEVSLTNTPAQKMLHPITELTELKEDKNDMLDKPAEKSADKSAEKPVEKNITTSEGTNEPEDLTALFEALSGCARKITNHPNLKNKTGNAGLRAKFKDIMNQIGAKLQSEFIFTTNSDSAKTKSMALASDDYEPSFEEKLRWLVSDLVHTLGSISTTFPNDPGMDTYKDPLKVLISRLTLQLDEKDSTLKNIKETKEDINMSDKLKEFGLPSTVASIPATTIAAEAKTSEEVIQLRESLRLTEEKLRAVETEKRKAEIKSKIETWLPKESTDGKMITSKIKSESVGRVSSFMESLSPDQMKEFSEIMDLAVPSKGMLAGKIGHGGSPDESEDKPVVKKVSEIEAYAAATLKADKEGKDSTERVRIFKEEYNRLLSQSPSQSKSK